MPTSAIMPTSAKLVTSVPVPPDTTMSVYPHIAWRTSTVILILILSLCLCFIFIKKKRSDNFWRAGRKYVVAFKPRLRSEKDLPFDRQSSSSLSAVICSESGIQPQSDSKGFNDVMASAVQEAPLQMLLNNLDVLEELFILLDPDSKGVKSTRHLATRCDFSSTWINYIYSMKDSKSPLVAVLEAVATRSPEWTVGHLAKQLREMNRNDAVAVLGKLSVSREAEAGNSGQKAGC